MGNSKLTGGEVEIRGTCRVAAPDNISQSEKAWSDKIYMIDDANRHI